jgi:hypothetical protein
MLLNEITDTFGSLPTDETAMKSFIEVHCSEALEAMRSEKRELYRGIDNREEPAFIAHSPVDRSKYLTSGELEAYIEFDKLLKANGFVAGRLNSIFATGSYSTAKMYSDKVYSIFPVNGFKFTWSPKVNDFPVSGALARLKHILKTSGANMDADKQEFLKRYDFRHDGLVSAIISENEIMIHGNYVALDENYHYKVIRDLVNPI